MTKHHLLSALAVSCALLLLLGSAKITELSKTITTVETLDKTPKSVDTTLSYFMPVVEATAQTPQKQTRGGVDVTCEVMPFEVSRTMSEVRKPVISDPQKPNYDVFEIRQVPVVTVSPEQVIFKLRVRNKQARVLKLIDVPIVMIIDGVQYSIPEDALVEWKNALVVQNFEKEYILRGPKLTTLHNAKAIYISINDVPTAYDEAGVVLRKENFEWFFGCSLMPTSAPEKVQFSYTESLAESKQCAACFGSGRVTNTCTKCNGVGEIKYKDIYDKWHVDVCPLCKGTKQISVSCHNCSGNGIIYYPKSNKPRETSNVRWTGWVVQVNTVPAGLRVCGINPDSRQYDWCMSANPGGKKGLQYYRTEGRNTYYLKVEYNGKTYEFEPYAAGKRTQKVKIDFTQPSPVITGGTLR